MSNIYSEKKAFVEKQLAPLLIALDTRIEAVDYDADYHRDGTMIEMVLVYMEDEEECINVTGDADLYIVIDVLSHLYGSAEYAFRQLTNVKKLQDEIASLKELQEQIGCALSDLDDAIFDLQRALQSNAQTDDDEEDKPDEA